MGRVHYREIESRSAINRVGGMMFKWSLNPYRGCVHGCVYCFARSTHRYFDLGIGEDFTSIIFVKTNLPEVLAAELVRRTWRRERVAVGTATDPYQPIEGRYRVTRRCLEAFARFRTPVSLVTKGTLIIRDLDVLQELTARAGASVCFSVPTMDRTIWGQTEPGTPPPEQRLRAMERLAASGVRAGVLMAPLLPGLTTLPAQIERTVRAAVDHGAGFVASDLVNLGPDVRDFFFAFLEREYPDLLAGYRRLYETKHAPKPYEAEVEGRVEAAKVAVGFGEDAGRDEPAEADDEPRQLLLPGLLDLA